MAVNFEGFGGERPPSHWRQMLDLILPPTCIACRTEVFGDRGLCPNCWRQVSFLSAPCCHVCGLPFDVDLGEDALCPGCMAQPSSLSMTRSAFRHDDLGRRLVLSFKFGDRLDAVPVLSKLMMRAGTRVMEGADLLIPIPLHRRRLFSRRFNQSALLAQRLSEETLIPADVTSLQRLRNTRHQTGLSRSARQRNVNGAFRVDAHRKDKLAGKTLILVDDVRTTGATLEAASRVLLSAGAAEVRALTLSRVVITHSKMHI